MRGVTCGQCRGEAFEPGFVEDAGGDYSKGYLRWIPGPLQLGPFGGAWRFGRRRVRIDTYRCITCGHLELFVHPPRDAR